MLRTTPPSDGIGSVLKLSDLGSNFTRVLAYQLGLSDELPSTTGNGFMDRAQFIATKSHGTPLDD